MTLQAERALQQEIMLRLKAGAWPVIALPIPNAIYFPARTDGERSIIARVIYQMKNAGQIVPGAPDLVLLWNGGGAMVELKRPKLRLLVGGSRPAGRPSERQKDMAERAAALGVHHAFVTSWDELQSAMSEWGITNAVPPPREAREPVGDSIMPEAALNAGERG